MLYEQTCIFMQVCFLNNVFIGGVKMKKINNIYIKKENKKKIVNIILSILILLIAFLFKDMREESIKEANEKVTDLNSIIISSEDKTDKKAYIDVKYKPYKFAVSDDTVNSYYIISDEKYMYIAYMSPEDETKLNNGDFENSSVKIEGITELTSDEIKKLAVDTYNESVEESNKISMEEFNDYFGPIYLNTTISQTSDTSFYSTIYVLLILAGVITFCINLYKLIAFRNSMKKLKENDEILNEMNDEKSFYYEKTHLCLTENYIVTFNGRINAIKYEDVVWMYRFEQRVNGIKSNQCIKIMNNRGKTYSIAEIDLVTKKKKEIYEEIWKNIVEKNDKIVLGYTQENIKQMKELYKKKK